MRKHIMARNRLRELRLEKKKTLAETAKIFHLQTTQYRRYEVNESDIPMELAIMFADYYNVTIDYLIYRSDNRNLTYDKALKFASEVKKAYDKYFT